MMDGIWEKQSRPCEVCCRSYQYRYLGLGGMVRSPHFEEWWWGFDGDVETRWRGSVVPDVGGWISSLTFSLWGVVSFRRGYAIENFVR